jgi:hypothetical protein
MKERPILFSGVMVRALIDGRKTQTRRVVKPQPEADHDGEPYWHVGGYRAWMYRGITEILRSGTGNAIECKYGQPGDRLWVKETFADIDTNEPPGPVYRATDPDWETTGGWKWTPSIFMPRWASRLTLEVLSVKVQKLQDISEEDAMAEGVEPARRPLGGWRNYASGGAPNPPFRTALESFASLWESINGPGSWALNPWVWCILFRKL